MSVSRMAAVVIGRNEGDRLAPSLQSVQAAGLPVVYVDSGSTDDSLAVAKGLNVATISLTPDRPFSAARGRNEGVQDILRRWPKTTYVMFLDGDCALDGGFPSAAIETFEREADCAIVTGHLSERSPDASIFNRLCAIEWRSPAGRIENFAALGGIMAARIAAFREVGGFNEQIIAGEDSELGVRLSLRKHSIIKIDKPMAVHDAQLLQFRQWWMRAVRGGHALAQRFTINGGSPLRDCRREFFSTLMWGLGLPMVVLVLLWPTRGLSLALLGGYGLLGLRIYLFYRRSGLSRQDSSLAARFMLFAKFANMLGVLRFGLNRLRGQFRIIEYK